MPPRKRPAKKTAAKPVDAPELEAQEDAPKPSSWPLSQGRYLSVPVIARNAVSSGPAVRALRAALGLREGFYDADVRRAVLSAQEAAGLPVTGVVTESDWLVIVDGVTPAAE